MNLSLSRHRDWFLLAVLLAGMGCAGWVLLLPGLWPPEYQLHRFSLAAVVVLAIAAIWLYRHGMRSLLCRLRKQLEQIRGDEEHGRFLIDQPGPDAEISERLNSSLCSLRGELRDLQRTNRMLQISSKISDLRRKQTEDILLMVHDAVVVTNQYDELMLANEAAEELLGLNMETSYRKHIDDVITDGPLRRQLCETRQLGIHQPHRMVEYTVDQHGTDRTFSILVRCLPGPGGTASGVVAILHDITREKEIEHSKSEFVSNVSHELKTPLASIKAYIEMLLDGEVDDVNSIREFYETIAREADRLHRMIDRILIVSRIESGSVKIMREPVSIAAVIKQVIGVIRPQAHAKNITVVEKIPPIFYQVEADYDLICQAILNLLTNAVKYTHDNGGVNLVVTVDERREVVVVEVSDTGIGIPADELPCIFQKFYRVRANMKMASGTGLGLPLVKFIIETIHGSKLSVTSTPGKGSTFSFELPLVK